MDTLYIIPRLTNEIVDFLAETARDTTKTLLTFFDINSTILSKTSLNKIIEWDIISSTKQFYIKEIYNIKFAFFTKQFIIDNFIKTEIYPDFSKKEQAFINFINELKTCNHYITDITPFYIIQDTLDVDFYTTKSDPKHALNDIEIKAMETIHYINIVKSIEQNITSNVNWYFWDKNNERCKITAKRQEITVIYNRIINQCKITFNG